MKLKKEFTAFHAEIKLDKESEVLKEKRDILQKDIEEKLPDALKDMGCEINKSDIEIFDQGSYRHNTSTTIKGKTVDRDIAVAIPIDINEFDNPVSIKKKAKNVLTIKDKREPVIKRPCITVEYKTYNIHIDFPIYGICNGMYYLAKGKENSSDYIWEECDPKGLNSIMDDWFKGDSGNQFRRIVRYLKSWKQFKFNSCSKDNIPPSIGLTILAHNSFYYVNDSIYGDDDFEALSRVVQGILSKFELHYDAYGNRHYYIKCTLPTKPYSDIFFKMDVSGFDNFHDKISHLNDSLESAADVTEDYEASKILQKEFGEDFPLADIPEVKTGIPRRNNSNA